MSHAAWAVLLALLFAFLVAAPSRAAGPSPKPGKACDAPVRRQFDFWIGDWDVRSAQGTLVGRNRISRVHGGCALEERWTGNGGVTGTSLNAWDAQRERWRQTWVDNTAGLLMLEGGWRDGRMVLQSRDVPAAAGGAREAIQRITWQPLPDGRVRQLWEASSDDGATWTTAFDGYYTRRP